MQASQATTTAKATNVYGKETLQETLEGIAELTGLTAEQVRKGFLKCPAADLRKVQNGLQAAVTFMADNHEEFSDEDNREIYGWAIFNAMTGDYGPDVDLSELADEVEAAAATIQ